MQCRFKNSLLPVLFACLFLFTGQHRVMAKNEPFSRALLLEYLLINDSTIITPEWDENKKQRNLIISEKTWPGNVAVKVDSFTIQKLGLKKYRFKLGDSYSNYSLWSLYPYKEYSRIKGTHQKLWVEAIDNRGHIYAETLNIDFAFGVFSAFSSWVFYLLLGAAFAVFIFFWLDYRQAHEKYFLEKEISKRTRELSEQKLKYEDLLTNYLPKEEFEKLKEKNKDKTIRFKMVTVLFSNILGFTKIAEQDDAEQLIDDLDRFFFEFDAVVKRLHIEKIKSIGDSYMCAGGIPQKNRTNPIEVVLAAFEMQQYMNMLKNQYVAENKKIWDLRMGIHTGPVFSNSGASKKRLEVWGDSVNIASRMEASGEIGKVNITGMTYELVKDYFLCQYRGKMPVKYKGEIDMYFIEGFRPALSVDGVGLKPNSTFVTRLALIRFDDLEEHIMNILEEKLPKNLYYHNLKHTIDVTVQVELIGREEGISDEEMLLLKTAALFHDTGFISTYKNHEEVGAQLAEKILPDYDYTQEQIERIKELIMVTKLPPKPKNLLEEIMCDADLDYLGRVDFIPVSGNLFRELKEHDIIKDDINKWNEIQISFIENHQYFTDTAKRLRDVNKNNQLEAIRKLVAENS